MPARADDKINEATFAFRAEMRGVEEGHNAVVQDDGSIRVVSDTTPGQAYTVRFYGLASGRIWFTCDCISGQNRRHLSLPCKHASRGARRLEREGFAKWENGIWNMTDKALSSVKPVDQGPDDPFEGLPR